MGKKREGDKSYGYSEGFHNKNAPAQGFQSNIAELKDTVFTIRPNHGGAANFKKSSKAVSSCIMQNYDSGILLAKGIREGKLPVVVLDPAPRRKKGEKRRRKGMKHTKHRYFFVKDKVDQGDIDIVHSPADAPFPEDQMWADVLTEPKSGRLFLEDRSVLMNCPVNYVENREFDKASDEHKPEEVILTKTGSSYIKV